MAKLDTIHVKSSVQLHFCPGWSDGHIIVLNEMLPKKKHTHAHLYLDVFTIELKYLQQTMMKTMLIMNPKSRDHERLEKKKDSPEPVHFF